MILVLLRYLTTHSRDDADDLELHGLIKQGDLHPFSAAAIGKDATSFKCRLCQSRHAPPGAWPHQSTSSASIPAALASRMCQRTMSRLSLSYNPRQRPQNRSDVLLSQRLDHHTGALCLRVHLVRNRVSHPMRPRFVRTTACRVPGVIVCEEQRPDLRSIGNEGSPCLNNCAARSGNQKQPP